MLLALLVLLGACAWSLRRWWLGLRLVLVLVVLEGAIRKWVLPDQQQLVYLAKDVLLLAVYAGFLRDLQRVRRVAVPPAILIPLLVSMVWGAFEILNPQLPSPLVGIFGWKAYFWYVPLLWLVPAAFRDLGALERFLRRYALLTLPVVALGVVQFRAPATSVLNRYAWGDDQSAKAIATFGEVGAARVTSTFSYITGFSSFLVVAGVLLMGLLAARGFRWRGNGALWLALGAVPVGVLVSGSRGPLILLAGLLPVLVLFARRGVQAVVAGTGRFLLAAALLAAIGSYVGAPALEAFSYRARSSEENLGARMLAPFREPFELAGQIGLFGYGIGATHQAAPALVPDLRPGSWLDGLSAEAESSRVMIELGPLGFLLHFAFRIGIAVYALAAALRLRGGHARALSLGAAFFCASQLPGAIVVNVTASFFFWFFGGLILLAFAGEREATVAEARELRKPLAAPPKPEVAGGRAR